MRITETRELIAREVENSWVGEEFETMPAKLRIAEDMDEIVNILTSDDNTTLTSALETITYTLAEPREEIASAHSFADVKQLVEAWLQEERRAIGSAYEVADISKCETVADIVEVMEDRGYEDGQAIVIAATVSNEHIG